MGGLDWRELKEDFVRKASTPVINLILHVRHADSKDQRYAFLKNRAIRICNSVQVADALQRTHKVNGPLYSIPNALDSDALPAPLADRQKDIDLLIVGCKEPELARKLNFLMRCHPGLLPKILFKRIVVMRSHVSRKTFLHQLNRAKTTLFLLNQREGEGVYRPALEGMAPGTT